MRAYHFLVSYVNIQKTEFDEVFKETKPLI